jgi:hypothetical protein
MRSKPKVYWSSFPQVGRGEPSLLLFTLDGSLRLISSIQKSPFIPLCQRGGIRNGHAREGEIPARDRRNDGEEKMDARLLMSGMTEGGDAR